MKDKKLKCIVAMLVISTTWSIGITAFLIKQNVQRNRVSIENVITADMLAESRAQTSFDYANPKTAIVQKIIAREVVENIYFNYLDDVDLISKIEEYNQLTARYRGGAEDNTIAALGKHIGLDVSEKNYKKLPGEVDYIVKKLSKYSMYKNAQELIGGDLELAQMLLMEPFVTNKAFLEYMENEINIVSSGVENNTTADDEKAYFELMGSIVSEFEIDNQIIAQKVIAREVIEDTYFGFIKNAELLESIKQYNKITAEFRGLFAERAIWETCNFYDKENDLDRDRVVNYFDRPFEVKHFVPKIIKYTLDRESTGLILSDSRMSSFIRGDGHREWPQRIRYAFSERLPEYYDLADSIVKELKDEG